MTLWLYRTLHPWTSASKLRAVSMCSAANFTPAVIFLRQKNLLFISPFFWTKIARIVAKITRPSGTIVVELMDYRRNYENVLRPNRESGRRCRRRLMPQNTKRSIEPCSDRYKFDLDPLVPEKTAKFYTSFRSPIMLPAQNALRRLDAFASRNFPQKKIEAKMA